MDIIYEFAVWKMAIDRRCVVSTNSHHMVVEIVINLRRDLRNLNWLIYERYSSCTVPSPNVMQIVWKPRSQREVLQSAQRLY